MKKLFIVPILLVFTVAGGVYYFVSKRFASHNDEVHATCLSNEVSDEQIIDVRDFQEYKQEHISGAINIPLSEIKNFDIANLKKDQKIWVYCQSGVRADLAVKMLRQRGFKNVDNLGSLDSAKAKFKKVCSGEKLTVDD